MQDKEGGVAGFRMLDKDRARRERLSRVSDRLQGKRRKGAIAKKADGIYGFCLAR